MKIYTSYFGNLKKLTKAGIVALGVSRYPPHWFSNPTIVELAPQPWMLAKGVSMEQYDKTYQAQLSKLNPAKIVAEIKKLSKDGKDVALCCFEKEQRECHRYDIMNWLKKAGYDVEEYFQAEEAPKPKTPPLIQGLLF